MSDVSPLSSLFLGRQPILDNRQVLIGYELLFRNSNVNRAVEVAPGFATADVVCTAFTELGLGRALDGYKAFVIVDAAFLEHDAIEALPPDGVVFELDAALLARSEIAERCLALSGQGYSFCLIGQGEETGKELERFAEIATFLKFDIAALTDERLKPLLDQARARHFVVIASHVETREQHERALALGFQLFQGYYFAEPKLIEGRKIDASLQNLLRIIQLLNQDAELPALEQIFKADAALTLKLLRLTNSVGVGLRIRMEEILDQLAVVPQLRMALLAREGEIGQLLELTDCYDNDDPAGVQRVLAPMGQRVDASVLNQCLAEAIAWVQSLSVEREE